MASQDTGQERTEQATPKRLSEARQQGQVARSRELNTTIMMLAAGMGLMITGERVVSDLTSLIHDRLSLDRAEIFDTWTMIEGLAAGIQMMMLSLAPFFGLMLVAALFGPLAMGGWSFSTEALGFKWERLNPGKGLKRVFGWSGLLELVKALVKFILLTGVAVLVFRSMSDDLMRLGLGSVTQGLSQGAEMLLWLFLWLAAALIVVALVDVPFQLWDHARKLRMTLQEIKEEQKETEGSPEVRGRLRGMQQELARKRMMHEVPKADVIVVNPTHYAVALRYDQEQQGAPKLIAKGTDHIALKIREVASQHGIPIFSAPPLARALSYSTELGQTIPGGLYTAVAKVLAYVYQVKIVTRHGGLMPEQPTDLAVPGEFLEGDKR